MLLCGLLKWKNSRFCFKSAANIPRLPQAATTLLVLLTLKIWSNVKDWFVGTFGLLCTCAIIYVVTNCRHRNQPVTGKLPLELGKLQLEVGISTGNQPELWKEELAGWLIASISRISVVWLLWQHSTHSRLAEPPWNSKHCGGTPSWVHFPPWREEHNIYARNNLLLWLLTKNTRVIFIKVLHFAEEIYSNM